jgi:hypothetical protein
MVARGALFAIVENDLHSRYSVTMMSHSQPPAMLLRSKKCLDQLTSLFSQNLILLLLSLIGVVTDPIALVAQELSTELDLPKPTDKPATMSFDELKAAMTSYYTRLKAVEVTHDQITHDFHSDAKPIPHMTYHFAMKGENRFRSQFLGGKEQTEEDLQQAMIESFNGDEARNYLPGSRRGTVTAEKDRMIDEDGYLQALGIPLTNRERADTVKSHFLLPTALNIEDCDWKVRPMLETIDGADCHVLESKYRQAIWVDPQIGCAMRFRESYQFVKNTPKDDWPLQLRYSFQDYAQLKEDLYLPRLVRIISFMAARQPTNLWNQPNYITTHKTTRLAVNDDVPDSLFTFSFPTGSEVRNEVNNRYYRVGDTNEELEIVIDAAQPELPNNARRKTWLIALNVIAVLIVLVLILIRRRRAKRTD